MLLLAAHGTSKSMVRTAVGEVLIGARGDAIGGPARANEHLGR